jgi:hypothetical protein
MGSCTGWPAADWADGRGKDDGRVRGAAAVLEPCSASVAAASVLIGEIDSGLNLSYRVFDEAHGPIAMAALVRRRRVQGLHCGSERGQGALHIAPIRLRRRRGKRERGGAESRGAKHPAAGERILGYWKSSCQVTAGERRRSPPPNLTMGGKRMEDASATRRWKSVQINALKRS